MGSSCAGRVSTHPLVAVAKRFTIDWINLAGESVPPTIMTPDYHVHIGETELVGLDAYTTGTIGQLHQFPGLGLTVHELVTDGDRLALVFTEHGASARTGTDAAWAGIALFAWDGERLTENWTQEDYYARRRQLAGGPTDVVRSPAVAPWTTAVAGRNLDAEVTVASWLSAPAFDAIRLDDGGEAVLDVECVEVLEIFSAGDRVAFAGTWTGRYRGGLAGVPVTAGRQSHHTLGIAGVLTVRDQVVVGGSVVTDRLGLRKRLLPAR